jgi:5-(carboxyamino)imidazole ribonucleotide synthase
MLALAARPLGYHIHVLDPDPSCAARFVVERCVTASFDDAHAAADLAAGCSVVTLEIEKIALESLEAAERVAPVRPRPGVLAIVQNRVRQKTWLAREGFPLGPFRTAQTDSEVASAVRELGGACYVKSATGGYDGRGQVRVADAQAASPAWKTLGGGECVVERALDIHAEVSVLVARRPGGETAVYPPARNHHEAGILDWSVLPGLDDARLCAQATELGRSLAEKLNVVGLLVVEMFLTTDGQLLVNELAPRPHNTFHSTEVGSSTSQFEQAVRAICDLPLGSVDVIRPAAIVNLLGEVWLRDQPPAFARALALPGVGLHLYGKRVARPGRKMGHLSATGDSPDEAVRRVLKARERLCDPDPPHV